MSLVAALGLPLLLAGSYAPRALAHGALAEPADRGFFCRFMDPGGVENPSTDGCKAAKAAAGTSEVYQYNSVISSNANRRSLSILPDGNLCNAGDNAFRGFNLAPRAAKYTATPVKSGDMQFNYRATAPHRTAEFRIFISKPSYTGAAPLTKADIELVKEVTDFQLAGDTFRFTVPMPNRAPGSQAVVLTEWNRVTIESGESYFTCSDVVYQ